VPQRNCDTCGKAYEAQRRTSKFCSPRCRYHNHLSDRKRVTIPRDLRFRVLRRDSFRCVYCGATPAEKELRIDHVVSIKDGGARTAMANLVTACNPCNAGKSDLSVEQAEIPWVFPDAEE
jgi:5-methylcytosine-specific restriction endonuclease McrA